MSARKKILITGASRGIGRLTVEALLEEGHGVVATMRDPAGRNADVVNDFQELAQGNSGSLTVLEMDVTDDASVSSAIREAEAGGPIDVLINNAGAMPVGVTEGYTVDQVKGLFDLNLYSIVRTSRAILPGMRARGEGLIINLSSSAGRLSIPYFGLYCASKWAMEAYVESLGVELAGTGVEAVLVEPSGHKTDLVATSEAPADAAVVAGYGARARGGERLLAMFNETFAAGEAINDAGNVARVIADLIDQPSPRPVRTAVGEDMGVAAINAATQPIQNGLVEALRPVFAA